MMHWSQTRSTVALSSGEAELGGICRGASRALGLQAVARDLGLPFELEILTDATAAIGICRRRGLGKIRHLAVADLWVQDRLRAGDFALTKVAGADNMADIFTKYTDRATLAKHLLHLDLHLEDERAETAPMLTH